MDVYQEVTDRIVAELEQGRVPWRKPWNVETGQPRSIDGRAYRGINVLLLGLTDYADPRWGTYKAIQRHGGQVQRGEKSTEVVLWKPIKVRDAEAPGGQKQILLARTYRVFNVAQAEWPEGLPELTAPTGAEHVPTADEVYAGYLDSPVLTYGFSHAAYVPSQDQVQMPSLEAFEGTARFYSTLFHELAHSTGHPSRLARFTTAASEGGFGSESYAKEELIAEMAAAMLTATVGIEVDYPQSASYIANWLEALHDDRQLLISAAARAQKAVDRILSRANDEHPEQAEQLAAVA